MGAWNVDLITNVAQAAISKSQSKSFASNNSAGFSSDYAKILSQKMAQVDESFQSAIETLANQSQVSINTNSMPVIETIKRFRPDGSITITTYKDGQIDSTTKIKPHLVPMPDYSVPETPEGQPDIKLVERFTVAELLMLSI